MLVLLHDDRQTQSQAEKDTEADQLRREVHRVSEKRLVYYATIFFVFFCQPIQAGGPSRLKRETPPLQYVFLVYWYANRFRVSNFSSGQK